MTQWLEILNVILGNSAIIDIRTYFMMALNSPIKLVTYVKGQTSPKKTTIVTNRGDR